MDNGRAAYVRLQKHLDKQAVGFPATKSGVEIRILKHIFTPEEAQIATCLSYKLEPLETLFKRAGNLVASPDALARLLDRIQKKGGIETHIKDGIPYYCNTPLVVGMYEMQLNRLTPEFIKDFKVYTHDKAFGIAFLGTDRPQMRTIPIAKSILPQHHVSTYDEITQLLKNADGPFAIHACICRKKKEMEGEPCRVTDRKETCLCLGSMARTTLASANGRQISRDEAISIIEQNQKDGLVLQPSNTGKTDFICSCCVPTCAKNAVSLLKKKTEVEPPRTREDLYEIIMANRKGRLGKFKLHLKFIIDAVRTGRTDLLAK